MPLHQRFRFPLEFISQELIEKRSRIEAEVQKNNENKFDWETLIEYNMQVILFFTFFLYLFILELQGLADAL